jgi:hypothetical protein
LRRLRVYIGVSEELSNMPRIRILDADASRLSGKYVYLSDITRELGWRDELSAAGEAGDSCREEEDGYCEGYY